ncbi:MAG: T9SS type A sorting domain-containing protein [Chitinophagales bacterium]
MRTDTSSLIKKLKQYSALTAPALAVAAVSNAQVVYTDVNPDKEIIPFPNNPQGGLIDMNNDGIYEFILAAYTSFALSNGKKINLAAAGLYADNGDGLMGYTNVLGSKKFYYPNALAAGAVIDSNGHFRNTFHPYETLVWFYKESNIELGQWNDVTDKYLGVKFKDQSGATHYGWVRMDVQKNPMKIVLKDYAYESTPDLSIHAGDGLETGISTVPAPDKIAIYSFGKNVFIQSPIDNSDPMIITITDVSGKILLNQTSDKNNLTLSLTNFSSGIYIVNAVKGGDSKTRKIFLQ